MTLYHYTTVGRARLALTAGALTPRPTPLYRDLSASDLIRDSKPVVWLTENPLSEATSWCAIMVAHGMPCATESLAGLVGLVARITVPKSEGMLLFADFASLNGPLADWDWNIRSALMAGGDPALWWVSESPVPVAASRCEVLLTNTTAGTTWGPI